MNMSRVIIAGLWLEKKLENPGKTFEKPAVLRGLLAGFGIFFIIMYLYRRFHSIGIL